MRGDAAVADHLAEEGAAPTVDLHRHEAVVALHHVRGQAELAQGVGGLDPQQPAADHHADPGRRTGLRELGGGADVVEVVKRTVDVASGQVMALNRRHERPGSGCEDEGVVGQLLARVERDRACAGIDRRDAEPRADRHPRIGGVGRVLHVQRRAVPRADVGRQPHPVVRGVGLLADHRDNDVGAGVLRAERGDETVGDHPVSDNDDVLGHVGPPSGLCGSG